MFLFLMGATCNKQYLFQILFGLVCSLTVLTYILSSVVDHWIYFNSWRSVALWPGEQTLELVYLLDFLFRYGMERGLEEDLSLDCCLTFMLEHNSSVKSSNTCKDLTGKPVSGIYCCIQQQVQIDLQSVLKRG